jgi:hypothetical protein
MSDIVPANLDLLRQAAELRADGTPWPAVAAKLAVSVGQLRRVADEHARAYGRLTRRANRELHGDTMRRTVAKLGGLLDSPEQGVVMMAAATLVRYDLARMRQELQTRRERDRGGRWARRDELPPAPSVTVTAVKTGRDTAPAKPEMPEPERVVATQVVEKSAHRDSVTVGCDSDRGNPVSCLGSVPPTRPPSAGDLPRSLNERGRAVGSTPLIYTTGGGAEKQARLLDLPPCGGGGERSEPVGGTCTPLPTLSLLGVTTATVAPDPQPAPVPPAQPVARKGKTDMIDAIRRRRWLPSRLRQADEVDRPPTIGVTGRDPRPTPPAAGVMTSFLGT